MTVHDFQGTQRFYILFVFPGITHTTPTKYTYRWHRFKPH